MDGGAQHHARPDLREATDMIERTMDNEGKIVRESLSGNEILGIGNHGPVADDNTFRASCGASGIEHICTAFGRRT